MDNKNVLIQPSMGTSGAFIITCPFCSTRFEKMSDVLELESLICPNCTEQLPFSSLVFLHADDTPIEEKGILVSNPNDMKSHGTSIQAILKHRREVDDLKLAYSIGFQLFEKVSKYGIDCLSNEEKFFLATYELDNEINNGGYLQYFNNSSGNLAFLVIEALQSIGSRKFLNITKKAIDIYGELPSKIQNERMNAIARITNNYEDNAWDKCDACYYEIEDENIANLLLDYADLNKDKFTL